MLLWVKVGAIVVAVVGLFLAGYHLGGLKGKAQAEAAHVVQLTALADAYQAQAIERQAKERAYDQELTTLHVERAATPDLVVRLCPDAPRAPVPAAREGGRLLPAGAGNLPPAAVPDPEGGGADIGAALFALADRADEIVARCRQ
jgi:hypothetical protein